MESQQGAEDVPVIYLHEIKRQYLQGEAALTILDNAKLALWAGQSVALVAPHRRGDEIAATERGLAHELGGNERVIRLGEITVRRVAQKARVA